MSKRREIKSFVLRQGRMSQREKIGLGEFWPLYGIDIKNDSMLNFKRLFGNTNPVVLDIGFGMGTALVEAARQNKSTNYVGVEVFLRGIGSTLHSIHDHGLGNLKIVNHDAVELLKKHIPDHSLSKCCIFFPDPWHKSKHKKRRLINDTFLGVLSLKLIKGGGLHIATDWEDYAQSCEVLLRLSKEFVNLRVVKGGEKGVLSRLETKYERRGVLRGHKIFDLLAYTPINK
jgi:tRNA (guanine-N7-)-methyltransferase